MERIIAFDVETPNSFNDRMSAIGIAVIQNGAIFRTWATLVNPETHFDPFNISLTGITPEQVRTAPTFPQLWDRIGRFMCSGLLLAHNATFDLRVLACCLQDYGIPAPACLPYACTVQMGRRCYPQLPNHRLNTLCGALGIPLDHHRADSDSRACAELLLNYLDHGLDLNAYRRMFDLKTMRTVSRY